jgi:hypothetical protein
MGLLRGGLMGLMVSALQGGNLWYGVLGFSCVELSMRVTQEG